MITCSTVQIDSKAEFLGNRAPVRANESGRLKVPEFAKIIPALFILKILIAGISALDPR